MCFLDREDLDTDVIHIEIRASDIEGLHADAIVIIRIDDVNDNPPNFPKRLVTLRIPESMESGTQIYKLKATDPDLGDNGEVSYRIQKGSVDTFVVEPSTGSIRLAPGRKLDRESIRSYRLTVMAFDQGVDTSLSSSITVVIHIDDVNDSRPRFETRRIEVDVCYYD